MSGVSASAAPTEPARDAGWRRLRLRTVLLALGVAALPAGLYGGLARLGWPLPAAGLAEVHGPLMVAALFGSLISLERAVALGRDWAYAAPALSIAGGLALVLSLPVTLAIACFATSAAFLTAASYVVMARQPAVFTATLLLGALALLAGDVLWLTGSNLADVAGWWLAFLILTIFGERLELSRMLQPKSGSAPLLLFAIGLLATGARNGLQDQDGAMLFGLGLLACSAWMVRHDIAIRNLRQAGQTRFSAICMVLGLAWLGAAGTGLVAGVTAVFAFGYDLAFHIVAIGFVFSMVFGHAPIILPALTGVRVAFLPVMFVPLGLLQAAVLMRIAGSLTEMQALRLWSGPLATIALIGFAICVAIGARMARNRGT